MLQQNGRPRDWDFNNTRLRSGTWNSEILPCQCLFSKLRQSYAPFWQEVITVIVALFPKLKLSRTLWGSGVQICCVFSISYLLDIGFIQPPWPSPSSKGWIANLGREGIQKGGETIKWWYSLETGSWFLLREICITMSLSSTELEPPRRWRMVTSD